MCSSTRNRERRDYREMRGLIESSWGYAITCHKAQGSQLPTVVVFDDGLGRTAEDRAAGSTPRSRGPSGGW